MQKPVFEVRKVIDEATRTAALKVRQMVFVEEQQVPAQDEYDQYDEPNSGAEHFLVTDLLSRSVCGTARWRFADKGIKLERFAVLEPYRNQGAGHILVGAVLQDISNHDDTEGKTIYLHAQLRAVPFYERAGFEKQGDIFEECNIKHYQMVKTRA